MERDIEELKARRLATIAWIYASAGFVALEVIGLYLTDAVRDANGNKLPVIPVVIVTLVVLALTRKYFLDLYRRKARR